MKIKHGFACIVNCKGCRSQELFVEYTEEELFWGCNRSGRLNWNVKLSMIFEYVNFEIESVLAYRHFMEGAKDV